VTMHAMQTKADPATPCWVLYLIECRDGTLYAGITTDLARRFAQHIAGTGARYTRSHPPARVVASMTFSDRSSASKAEAALKKLPRAQKAAYFGTAPARGRR